MNSLGRLCEAFPTAKMSGSTPQSPPRKSRPNIVRLSAVMPPPINEPTQMLVVKVRQGDARARETLVIRFLDPLRKWAHGRLPAQARGLGDTEDLVQITVMRALNRIEQFRNEGKGSFLAYLRQILMNELRDEIRRGNRHPQSVDIDEDLVDKNLTSPVELVLGQDCLRRYESTLAALNRRQQSVVVMRIEFCMSYAEIAAAVGETADGVRMMIARAMVKLAAGLEEFDDNRGVESCARKRG